MDNKATSSVMAKEHEMTNTGYEDQMVFSDTRPPLAPMVIELKRGDMSHN